MRAKARAATLILGPNRNTCNEVIMANFSLQPGRVLANPIVIPTPFALAHAEIQACTDQVQLMETQLRLRSAMWDLSAWAHLSINQAAVRRIAELRGARI